MPSAPRNDGMPLSKAVSALLNNDAVKTEILKRIEAKVDHTNGTVADIQEWRIRHEAQEETRQEIKDRNETEYKSPLITGVFVVIVSVVIQLGVKFLNL